MVTDARVEEMDTAARAGRAYVVACTPRLVTSAIQAMQLGKDILMWLAKECSNEELLPGGMVKPEDRTDEHILAVFEHWLDHRDMSIDPKKTKAQQRNRYTQQRERSERENPGMVTMMLSSAVMASRKVLGKAVGQEVLSFQRRGAPLDMSSRMHQQVRAWHSGKRERDQSGGGSSKSKPRKSAAEVMQPQAKRSTAWGQQPAGGWTAAQTRAWETEQQGNKTASEDMDEVVQKAIQEYRRDPAAVPKETEEAIKNMGVRPDKKMVARQAAQVIAYRLESRKTSKGSAARILYDKSVSGAVRAMVGDYESKH
jgi:hypothetical protein